MSVPDHTSQYSDTLSAVSTDDDSRCSSSASSRLSQGSTKLRAVARSVASTARKATTGIAAFFPKISKAEWRKQEKASWEKLAEDRDRREERERERKEQKDKEKREYDKLRQRVYRAAKRKAKEPAENSDGDVAAASAARKGKVNTANLLCSTLSIY